MGKACFFSVPGVIGKNITKLSRIQVYEQLRQEFQ